MRLITVLFGAVMISTFRYKFASYVYVQLFAAICVNLCEIINGYGVGWSATILPKFDDPARSPLPHPVTEFQKSWIATIIFFGCFSAFTAGYLANRIGRKKVLIIGGFVNTLTYILLACANNVALLYTGRFMVGASICFLMSIESVYIGEIASPNIRGIIMTSMGVGHSFGSLLVYCIAPYVDYKSVQYVCIAMNVLYIAVCCYLPESPMFYVLKDDEDTARTTLLRVRNIIDTEKEIKALMEKAQQIRTNNNHIWKELFKVKSNIKSLFIAISLTMFQQGSGILAVVIFANTIFEYAGSSIPPDIATIIVGATFVVGAVVAPMFIDRYGRRILLMISTSGLSCMMVGLGVYFYLREIMPSSVENLGWLPLALLVLAQFIYSSGLSIVPYTLSGELFTPRVRSLGSPICLCSGMAAGFITSFLFKYIATAIGIHFTFWIFAIINACAFLFVVIFVPETMGKSLMEIQEMLE